MSDDQAAQLDLLEHAKQHSREAAAELDGPEDDIMPMFIWLGPYGLGLMPCIPMGNDREKDRIAAAMVAALVIGRATEAVFISTSWVVTADRGAVDESGPGVKYDGVMPSEHPERKEAITIMHAGPKGTGGMAQAVLTRHPDRVPDVGEWDSWHSEEFKVGGRFGEAMNDGLRMAEVMPPAMIEIIEAAYKAGVSEDLMEKFLQVSGGYTGLTDIGVMSIPTTPEGLANPMLGEVLHERTRRGGPSHPQ